MDFSWIFLVSFSSSVAAAVVRFDVVAAFVLLRGVLRIHRADGAHVHEQVHPAHLRVRFVPAQRLLRLGERLLKLCDDVDENHLAADDVHRLQTKGVDQKGHAPGADVPVLLARAEEPVDEHAVHDDDVPAEEPKKRGAEPAEVLLEYRRPPQLGHVHATPPFDVMDGDGVHRERSLGVVRLLRQVRLGLLEDVSHLVHGCFTRRLSGSGGGVIAARAATPQPLDPSGAARAGLGRAQRARWRRGDATVVAPVALVGAVQVVRLVPGPGSWFRLER